MAIGYHFEKCPVCGSSYIQELGRIEAGLISDDETEDYAVYECFACKSEFDIYTHPPEKNGE